MLDHDFIKRLKNREHISNMREEVLEICEKYKLEKPTMQLVQGIGYNAGKYPTKLEGKSTFQYNLWLNMLHRISVTYTDCIISENFKNFSYFYEWCEKQIGFGLPNYELDKDLLIKGNKLYSEETCVFIPKELNVLLTKRQNDRGSLPVGITEQKGRYRARCNIYGVRKHIGYFDTPELAFEAYKLAKENHIKDIAHKYKDSIDIRVFNALIKYKVDIGD